MKTHDSQHMFLLVQGRTLPQIGDSIQYFPSNWKDEFPLMKDLGFYGIEWIYDKISESDNPILSEKGRNEILEISNAYDIKLENIVLDWFIRHPLLMDDEFTVEKKIQKLMDLIDLSSKSGFKRIIFPLLEQNNISAESKKKEFITVLSNNILDKLESNNIEMHLETSLPPEQEYELLNELNHKKIKLCFDMGNNASEGYDGPSTLKIIREFLGSVHIKDRVLHGKTVPLGEGEVKFSDVFAILKRINFNGPYSFQTFRNRESNNMVLLQNNLKFINTVMENTDHNE